MVLYSGIEIDGIMVNIRGCGLSANLDCGRTLKAESLNQHH